MNSPISGFSGLVFLLFSLFKYVELVTVAPETFAFRMLFLNEFVVRYVGGKESILISLIGVFSEMAKTGTELILCIFARNESAVSGDLSSRVGCHLRDFSSE